MRELKHVLIGLASAATWPIYLTLVAYAAKVAPWPRDLAWPGCVVILAVAGALFLLNAGRMAFRKDGWAEEVLHAPADVTRQMRRVVLTVAISSLVLLLPDFLLVEGMIAPGGRPISASALGRMLVLTFELTCWVLAYRLLRSTSPLLNWLTGDPDRLRWVARHRKPLAWSTLVLLGLVLALDGAGFRFSSRRLTFGGMMTLGLAGASWGFYLILLQVIARQAWRWTSSPRDQAPAIAADGSVATTNDAEADADANAKLRTLARVVVGLLSLFGLASIWNVDLALFYYISGQTLWTVDAKLAIVVDVGDMLQMLLIFFVTGGLWRYLDTLFTVAIFPRMPDDPGIRFAVVTLCRYAVLAVGVMAGLSAVHMGLERIGVVLAALGVGLGFGLQEIVSNFVSGIILLLERPIRVGDIVSVGEMVGKVDQINIRATTIINGDNQSMIIPNRQFITGNLTNWTHKDKVVRVVIRVNVALGTEADKVTDLLLSIAHADPDVLNNPVPVSLLDAIGSASLHFLLYAYVPEPSLIGRVKHRLYGEIQSRFASSAIVIPVPTQELRVHTMNDGARDHAIVSQNRRWDEPEPTPPAPRLVNRLPLPVPAENCHRGVDE